MNAQTLFLALIAANAISLAVFVGRKLFVKYGHHARVTRQTDLIKVFERNGQAKAERTVGSAQTGS